VYAGFGAVLVPSSPKLQAYPLTVPVEPLVKVTAKGAVPEMVVAVKFATGAAAATEIVLVAVLLPAGPITVSPTV
jgi:hypothetical protein